MNKSYVAKRFFALLRMTIRAEFSNNPIRRNGKFTFFSGFSFLLLGGSNNSILSFPRKRESTPRVTLWIPAFAGMTIFRTSLLLIFTFIIYGCSSISKTKSDSETKLPDRNGAIKTLGFNSIITFDFPDLNQTVSSDVLISNLDSISIKLIGPFGIPLGKLFAKKDSFVFLNSLQGEAWEGVPTAANMASIANMPLSFEELIKLMRCEIPGNPDDFQLQKTKDSLGGMVFRNEKNKTEGEFVYFSKEENSILQYQRKNIEGKITLNVIYRNFQEFSGFRLPCKIIIEMPQSNGKLTSETKKYNINLQIEHSFSFPIPEGVDRKKI